MRNRPAATPPDGIPIIFVVMGTRRSVAPLTACGEAQNIAENTLHG
jgi:hypothetical protein